MSETLATGNTSRSKGNPAKKSRTRAARTSSFARLAIEGSALLTMVSAVLFFMGEFYLTGWYDPFGIDPLSLELPFYQPLLLGALGMMNHGLPFLFILICSLPALALVVGLFQDTSAELRASWGNASNAHPKLRLCLTAIYGLVLVIVAAFFAFSSSSGWGPLLVVLIYIGVPIVLLTYPSLRDVREFESFRLIINSMDRRLRVRLVPALYLALYIVLFLFALIDVYRLGRLQAKDTYFSHERVHVVLNPALQSRQENESLVRATESGDLQLLLQTKDLVVVFTKSVSIAKSKTKKNELALSHVFVLRRPDLQSVDISP